MKYNPIRRKFYQMRRVLVETLGLPRHSIRPTSPLAALVPRKDRRRVWGQFHAEKIDIRSLMISRTQMFLIIGVPTIWGVVGCLMDTNVLLLLTISILLAFNLNALAWHSAKEIDDGYTLGDAALEMTTSVDCLAAEYQFTRNEIIVKLRRVLSDACGIDSSAITPDVKLDDLLSE